MSERLIEKWLPIAALGEESVRERRSMTALPPVYYLHVWWARRPLVASRAAVLASLLPATADRERFLHTVGIHGDPVGTRRRIDRAKRAGKRFEGDAYGYKRAFIYSPDETEREWIRDECAVDGHNPTVLDPTSGGGSIPFEAVRLGFNVLSNELNPVALLVQRATVEFPLEFGAALEPAFRALATEFVAIREERLKDLFPSEPSPDCIPTNYIWARTIACPYCEGLVPLSPNWRLAPDGTGLRLVPGRSPRTCVFEIVTSVREQSAATVSGGDAKCPFPDCGRVVDGDLVKEQAQSGRMGDQLCAVVFKRKTEQRTKTGRTRWKWIQEYRAPRNHDDNVREISDLLDARLPDWEARDIVPTEDIPEECNYERGHRMYGMFRWRDMFSKRQLLCHAISVEAFRHLVDGRRKSGRLGRLDEAAFAYLALSIDKSIDYSSKVSAWHGGREVTEHTFRDHAFVLKWSYAEMSPLTYGVGQDWAIGQTSKCIRELVGLLRPGLTTERSDQQTLFSRPVAPGTFAASFGNADSLGHLGDSTIDAVVMDPPYGSNVMYAELSAFFYVWLKRTAGYIFPTLFGRHLPDTDSEAVANLARFRGRKAAKALATRDYHSKMSAIFTECRRVLKKAGILTVMFTHKEVGAWDALARGLIDSRFTITASWPVNTESESSRHIKEKSAANSTVFLVCRPRPERQSAEDTVYWEDVEPRVASAVRLRIDEFQKAGLRGVDLYLSCFGPALEEFAKHWPLRRGQPKPVSRPRRGQEMLFAESLDPYSVTPEDALDAARREVKRWRLEQLLRVTRQTELDKLTEWFVLAWDAFGAPVFPYDEALRLARVVGVDLDRDVVGHLVEKKGSDLILWDSAKRGAKGALGPADGSRAVIDALHHVAWRIRQTNLQAGRELIERERLSNDPAFLAGLTALLEVLPMSAAFTRIDLETGPLSEAASDFEALENLRRLMFSDRVQEPEQLKLVEEAEA